MEICYRSFARNSARQLLDCPKGVRGPSTHAQGAFELSGIKRRCLVNIVSYRDFDIASG